MHLRTYPLLLVLSPDPRVQDAAIAISPSFALHRPLSRAVTCNTEYTSTTFRASFIQAMPRPRCSLSPQGSGACPTKPGPAHYCVQQTDHRGTFFYRCVFQGANTKLVMDGNPWRSPCSSDGPIPEAKGKPPRRARIDGVSVRVYYKGANTVNPPPGMGLDTHPTDLRIR